MSMIEEKQPSVSTILGSANNGYGFVYTLHTLIVFMTARLINFRT